MARKKRNSGPQAAGATPSATVPPAPGHAPAAAGRFSSSLPGEVAGEDWTVALLALGVFLAPALGVPNEEMLQDTLKSIVVSFAALSAAVLFFWHQRHRTEPLRWHGLTWLPLMLMAYALGSMAWSHTYLGAVEAIRWCIFSLFLWLGLNTFSRERLPLLAWGIHGGAAVASLWAVLQFLLDFKLFPQGPNPASTFVNRNFYAEFVVCTLPFSALLLLRARETSQIALLSVTSGLVILGVLMTGTRSALTAMWLELLVILPLIAWLYRRQLGFGQWDGRRRALAVGFLLLTVLGMGAIPSNNPKIHEEQRGSTGLERGIKRTAAINPRDTSVDIRMIMWKATVTMIKARPLSGVGAGAWESDIPLYQAAGAQLETDFYVHNEFLQLLAEYGLVGWAFLLSLFAYLIAAAWRTVRGKSDEALAEAPFRAFVLCSVLALFIVSNMGFPWRMASTGAIFAVCLGALAASDARLGLRARWAAAPIRWNPSLSQAGALACAAGLALAVYITQQAARAEQKIVAATRIALSISATNDVHNPKYAAYKAQLLRLIREGIEINPHYRKITPLVADELARWGDWTNAIWIWESVLSSRPYVVVLMSNIARGYASTGNPEMALAYLARARKIQPDAPAVRSLEVILLSRTGKEDEALSIAREALRSDSADYDLLRATIVLAKKAGDVPLALRAIEMLMAGYPQTRSSGYMELGNLYYGSALNQPDKALDAFRRSLALTPPAYLPQMQAQIPSALWGQLGLSGSTPAASTQTSARSK